jgi:hypothetical protein
MISAASSASPSPLQLLLQLSSRNPPAPTETDPSAPQPADVVPAADAGAEDGSSSLGDQIRAAIGDVVKNYTSGDGTDSSGGDAGDLRSQIHDAVDKVLKDNGVDPAQFRSALARPHHGHGHHHQAAAADSSDGDSTSASTASTADVDADGDTGSSAPPGSSTADANSPGKQLIDEILQSLTKGLVVDAHA